MSEMVSLMNLGGVTRADLCSVTASTSSAGRLILAAAHADISVFRDLHVEAQASVVRSAACCLQDLGLNLLELTIVAPLISRKSSEQHKFTPDVCDNPDTDCPTDQPSSTNFSLLSTESHVSIEQASPSVELQETTAIEGHDELCADKDVAADTFCCLQQLLCHR